MFRGEWDRVKRSAGRTPRPRPGSLDCPLLSATGRCTVYTVRPFICRLWGTTPTLACPEGCEPERWLTVEEAQDIFTQIAEVAGPEVTGPLGGYDDLWGRIALEAREERAALIERIQETVNKEEAEK